MLSLWAHFSLVLCGGNCWRQQIPHPHEVVGGGREGKDPPNLKYAAVTGLPQHPDRLHPTEHFLNPLPFALADLVTGVSRCAAIDRAAAIPLQVLRHMRSHVHSAHLFYEVFGVVALVAA